MIRSLSTFLFLLTANAFGATETIPIDSSADFSPGLFAISMLGLAILIILIGVGIVIAVCAVIGCLILVSLGILSTSALTGVFRRKFSSGFRALHYQVCVAITLPAGIAGCWGVTWILKSELPISAIVIIGSAAGISAGLIFAFVLDKAAGIIYNYFTDKKSQSQKILAVRNQTKRSEGE